MRTSFINTLCELARLDPRVWLLCGDLGYSVLERFAEVAPDRYVNVGVAEQNMAGVAAGLAHCGQIVFVYSIANFPTLRCLEQIRNDICYHRLAVRIVSVGGGYAYGPQGYTHHGLEDLAIMRSLPGMTVLAPGDPVETALLARACLDLPGPAYLRLGKAGEPVVHRVPPSDLTIGRAVTVQEGNDFTLISTGAMLTTAVAAAEAMEVELGLAGRVLSMHTLKPLDDETVRRAARETRAIVCLEEHSITNGLGSAVADVLAAMSGPRCALRKYGARDRLSNRIGSQAFMRADCGDLRALIIDALSAAGADRGLSA